MNGPTERELALLALMMRHIDGQWTPRANIEIGGPELQSWIRTALAGGGGGEKATCVGTCDFDYLHAELGRRHARIMELEACTKGDAVGLANHLAIVGDLESRLAAAEKRAEEAEKRADQCQRDRYDALSVKSKEGMLASEWLLRTGKAERERDALKAELAEAKNAVKTEYHRGYDDYRRDLDAALARVKELEAATASSVHIDMACIYVDGVKYTPEQVRSAVRRLATIRDAAGAQP